MARSRGPWVEPAGFTLIELLVVVVIIGILASIAIPSSYNQREKAWDAAVESDLRNAATAQETFLTAVGPGDSRHRRGADGVGFRPSPARTTSAAPSR